MMERVMRILVFALAGCAWCAGLVVICAGLFDELSIRNLAPGIMVLFLWLAMGALGVKIAPMFWPAKPA